ncbi:NfeD family protein [Sanguibacter antarcticus]|uniref:Membrane protein implicated in regulation of membrane protease activity n=1 Tax=Sanguibacter antarcticus TaxID=372484 RepID=A0A2A9E7P2_9MICO|nr:NfeD family protein [Sanguibacter antarcticus]PFG34581.1 membrane protein implicated in regulation of membrane protease activity [Sanguibacter antarcticus]
MLTFLIIGGVGLLLVTGSLLVGEVFELGDGALSGTSLGVGAIVFGAVGAIVISNDLPLWVAYVGSLVVAALVMVVVQVFIKRLRDTEDGQPVSLVGVQGVATSDIDGGRGEVSLDAASEVERRLAWAQSPIPEGTRVVVVEQSGSRVHVERATPAAPAHVKPTKP